MIRLGGNVVLTRLLVPEAFGLMSLVRGVTDGLKMLSDLGIQPAIVQSERADASFLNTAWTMQIIRGVGLFLLGCVLAWPVSKFYGEPVLLALVPAAAVMLLIDGFVATSLYMVQRQLRLAWLTVLETAAQTVNIGVAIALAAVFHTVWALVVGGLVGMGMRLALSHLWLPGIRNRFHWEPEAARKLYHFGKWIFGSTMLTFAAMYADRIILGKLLGMSLLGVYSIAFYLSRA
ncbi:MAG: oligosaccharide flippase family protein, partial [Phycisphaeraceae bacterium]